MLTDLIARAIAGQLKCSPECTDYPEGCGCAQNATAAVERAIADAGMVVVPAEPTEAMIEAGHGAVVFDESYSNSEYQQSPDTCWRAMIAAWGAESV